jgi:hypothetical protein
MNQTLVQKAATAVIPGIEPSLQGAGARVAVDAPTNLDPARDVPRSISARIVEYGLFTM